MIPPHSSSVCFFLIYRKPRIYLFWNFLDGNVFFNNFSRVLVIPKIKIHISNTAQNRKFSTRDFFSKCDQIRSFLRIWSHLLKKSLMEDFNFCAVWEINEVTSKCQTDVLNKTSKKSSKTVKANITVELCIFKIV